MKRALFIISIALLIILPSRHVYSQDMVDLGLPSKTLWKQCGEHDQYSTGGAYERFRDKLPTESQIIELFKHCTWSWEGGRYKVTGPNGNYIFMEANGYEETFTTKEYKSTDEILISASDGHDRGVYVSSNVTMYNGSKGVYVYLNDNHTKLKLFMFDNNSHLLDYSIKNKSGFRGQYSYRYSVHLVKTDYKFLEEKRKEEIEKQRKINRIYSDVFNNNRHLFTKDELRFAAASFRDEETARSEAERVEKVVKERQKIYDFIMQHSDVFPNNYYYDILPKFNSASDLISNDYNSLYNFVLNDYNKRNVLSDKINELVGDWTADKKKYGCNITIIDNQLFLTLKYKNDTIFAGYISSKIDRKTGNIEWMKNKKLHFGKFHYEVVQSEITPKWIELKIGWCHRDRSNIINCYDFNYKLGVFVLEMGNGNGRILETITFRK